MPFTGRLISTEDVPHAIDRAIHELNALKATYCNERTDIGNHGGDKEYLNATREAAVISRNLVHDFLAAGAEQIGAPQQTYDFVAVKELEGVDFDILEELEEILANRFSGLRDSYPPSNTDHLINRNGSVQ
ncbi:MAG: hypothetical protein ABJO09_01190 [Hyphomicrobiales bacterium]